MLKSEPNLLPDISNVLHEMRDAAMFSVTDLSSAYYSYKITEDSRWLTTFNCCQGSFQFKRLPMGISIACNAFQEIAYRMLHQKVIYDDDNKPIFESPGVVKMEPDPIPGVSNFFDDIIIYSKMQNTYALTVKEHYKKVEKVMSRLSFHDARISFEKSSFGKFKVSFLGWLVSHNFLQINPKRLQKIKDVQF